VSTSTQERNATAPALPPVQFGRWIWRQLTSMRTALLLLLLLAVAAIPGSFVPQSKVDESAVLAFSEQHPTLTPVFQALGLFDVYASAWFSAVYLLLMISLVGCIIPRTLVYARAVRARPPRAPRTFSRLPASASFETDEPADVLLQRAATALRRQRYRVDVDAASSAQPVPHLGVVRAERGYLREAGNLVFHVSLVVALVAIAVGSLWGYKGTVIVVEGEGFSNTLTQYDEFSAGAMFGPEDLTPFSMQVNPIDVSFRLDGPQAGSPELFRARGQVVEQPGGGAEPFDIRVNTRCRSTAARCTWSVRGTPRSSRCATVTGRSSPPARCPSCPRTPRTCPAASLRSPMPSPNWASRDSSCPHRGCSTTARSSPRLPPRSFPPWHCSPTRAT
jgi:cytochrome c biogenesis protein